MCDYPMQIYDEITYARLLTSPASTTMRWRRTSDGDNMLPEPLAILPCEMLPERPVVLLSLYPQVVLVPAILIAQVVLIESCAAVDDVP